MGAGTPENGFWPGATTPDLRLGNQGMNATTQTVNESDGTTRRIDHDRFVRACTEDMDATPVAPQQYEVSHDGETYMVDIEAGHCGCDDHRYRGDRVVCKHQCIAAIAHCYRDASNSELVARVLRHARSTGCPHGYEGCPGPTGPTLPCQDCIGVSGGDEWLVWCRVTRHDGWLDAGVDRGDGIATDGGQTPADRLDAIEAELVLIGMDVDDPDTRYRITEQRAALRQAARDIGGDGDETTDRGAGVRADGSGGQDLTPIYECPECGYLASPDVSGFDGWCAFHSFRLELKEYVNERGEVVEDLDRVDGVRADGGTATGTVGLPDSCAGCAKDIRHFSTEARELGWCPDCAPECYPLEGGR